MGSGKGGGGGRRRIAGGGRRDSRGGGGDKYTDRNVRPGTGLPEGEDKPWVQPAYYASLPPVENANRKINADGEVIVGTLGAPVANPDRFKTDKEAFDYLHKEIGVPLDVAQQIRAKGGIREVASVFPKGSEYIHHGAEGLGIKISNSKAIRVQFDGNEPLNTFNVGRSGVYSDWKQKYGGVWMEQKERIPTMGWKTNNPVAMKARLIDTFVHDKRKTSNPNGSPVWSDGDLHGNNWGLDSKGRPRVFDPGAVSPVWKKQILAGWLL